MSTVNSDDLRQALEKVDDEDMTVRITAVLNYVETEASQAEVADRYGKSASWLSRWYKKFSKLSNNSVEDVFPDAVDDNIEPYNSASTKYELYFQHTEEILRKEYKRSKYVEHNPSKGTVREHFVRKFLSDIYPEKYIFSNGEIIDSAGYTSREVDIAIYDENLPLLEHGMYQQLLAEGVFCHIEVKSQLDKNEIKNILSKARDIKNVCRIENMRPEWDNWRPEPNIEEINTERIPSFAFAYDGPKLEKMIEILCDLCNSTYEPLEQRKEHQKQHDLPCNEIAVDYEPDLPDLICVLGQYYITGVDDTFTYYRSGPLQKFHSSIVQAVNSHKVEDFSPSVYRSNQGANPPDLWYNPR